MRIYKPVGSKSRLVEIFQNVNKVKLNEDLGFGPVDGKTALAKGFQALRSGQLSIQGGGGNNTTVQMTDDNSTVQIVGVDSNKNEYTFVFKLTFTDGDQEGVYDVQSVQIQNFKYVGSNGGQTLELDESDLQNFNSQYTNELFDIVDKYIDVKGPQQPSAEELQEAIRIIDSIPFGKNSFDRMQTGKNYADKKPTNDSVRVESPELDKFVKEDLNALFHNPGSAGAGPLYPQAKELGVTNQYILRDALKEAGIELLDIIPSEAKETFWLIFKINGKKYKGLIRRNYGNAAKVVGGIKKRLEGGVENLTPVNELDKPAQRLIIPPSAGPLNVKENEFGDETDDSGYGLGSDVDTLEPENPEGEEQPEKPEEVPTIDDELPVDNEPTPEVSDEKKAKIYQAYDAIVARQRNPNYSPTTTEIMAELDKMAGISKPRNTRAVSKVAEPFLAEEKEKKPKEWDSEDSYSPFKQLGTKFKPKSQSLYPKKKKKPQTSVKIAESTDRDKYEDVVFLQGDEAFEPLERLDREGPDAALEYLKQWHYPGEHQGSQELSHGSEDKTYEKDDYIMTWNSRLGYIGLQYDMSKSNEPSDPETGHGDYLKNSGQMKSFDIKEEVYGDEDISGLPEVPSGYGEKGVAQRDMAKQHVNIVKPVERPVEEPAEVAEEEKPEQSQVEKDNPDLYPEGWKEMDGMFMNPDSPMRKMMSAPEDKQDGSTSEPSTGSMEELPKDDGMSAEPETDNIDQLAQDKEQQGELIPGGKGEGKSPMEFSQEQILMGLKVEMEHSDDPMYALEITLDHLTEDPEYYTTKDTPEDSAQANASADANGDDKETTDMLLGFKPHNVGDEIEGEEELEEPQSDIANTPEPSAEDQPSVTDDPELPKKEDELGEIYQPGEEPQAHEVGKNPGQTQAFGKKPNNNAFQYGQNKAHEEPNWEQNESAESELKQRDPATWHQIQIARKTLKMPDAMVGVMGGMSKEEAQKILAQHGIKESLSSSKPIITEAQIRTAKKTLSNSNVPTGMSKKEAVQILVKHLIK
jgi:hypothetical protein